MPLLFLVAVLAPWLGSHVDGVAAESGAIPDVAEQGTVSVGPTDASHLPGLLCMWIECNQSSVSIT